MQNQKSALGLDANVAALLCYVPICAINLIFSILVIVQDKTNKVARFHAFQSLFLMIACIVISIPLYIVLFVGFFVDSAIGFPIVSALVGLAGLAFVLAILFFLVMSAIKAFGGEIYKIPVIGNFADKYSN